MGIRSKAAHLVSDLATVLLNPISDKPSSKPTSKLPADLEAKSESEGSKADSSSDEDKDSEDSGDGPDTSSFTAFLVSLLSSSEPSGKPKSDGENVYQEDPAGSSGVPILTDSGRKRSLFSRGKQSLGRIYQAARLPGFRNQGSAKNSSQMVVDNANDSKVSTDEGMMSTQKLNEPEPLEEIPDASEPSMLLSEKTRSFLYASMPVLVQGKKWLLLYSTWRHGISISTLYRRSMLWPGLSLLVVGDRKGAVFGGLVEAPLRPTNKKRYQGSNNSFVFSNVSGDPEIFHPTGVNRYFTVCSTEYLALGGGSHFALYLDGDLLTGSSSASETYGNSCLAHTKDFDVKEVELWGFVYASKYEEMVSLLRTEAPGIWHLSG